MAWRPATARRSAPGLVVVVDELVAAITNLVAGANRVGWHVKNVNVPRDYTPDHVAEITNAREGDRARPAARRSAPAGDRGRQHLQAGTDFTNALRVDVPGRGWRARSDRDGLDGSASGERRAHRRGAPRRQGIAWPDEVAPYRGAPGHDRCGAHPKSPTPPKRLDPAGGRCWPGILTTTATSRRAWKFTDAELLGMPGSSPSRRARSRAAASRSPAARPARRAVRLDRGRRRRSSQGAGDDAGLTRRRRRSSHGRPRSGAPEDDLYAAPPGGGRRLARGDRARLAGPAQAPPPGRAPATALGGARPREADQRRPRLAERLGPAGAVRRASALGCAPASPRRPREDAASRHRRGHAARLGRRSRRPGLDDRRGPDPRPRARTSSAATRRERLAAVPGPRRRACHARRARPPRRRASRRRSRSWRPIRRFRDAGRRVPPTPRRRRQLAARVPHDRWAE